MIPKGVVAVLVDPNGRELANAADFASDAPGGFSKREAQEHRARRALSFATVRALASDRLSDAVDQYMAERIMSAMCNLGSKVIIVPIGWEENGK